MYIYIKSCLISVFILVYYKTYLSMLEICVRDIFISKYRLYYVGYVRADISFKSVYKHDKCMLREFFRFTFKNQIVKFLKD